MNWQKVKLGEAVGDGVFIDGDWVESKDQDPNGDVRLIQLADVGINRFVNKSNRFMTSDAAKRLRCTMLEPGDVLVARMPDPIGRACIFPGDSKPCATVVDVCIVRPDPQITSARFLAHLFNSPGFQQEVAQFVTGTTRQRISRGNLNRIPIPLPPLSEQQRIASRLDAADRLRAQRRDALRRLDALTHSLFLDAFGDPTHNPKNWPRTSMKAVCLKITDGTHFSPPIEKEGIPYITAKHLKKHGLDFFRAPWFISEEQHKIIYARCDPKPGDVLYIKDGATTGLAAINRYDFEFSMLSSLALLRPNIEICLGEYISNFLNHPIVKEQILSNMSGAAIQRLTIAKIKEIPIPLPPLSLQLEFATRLEQIASLRARMERSALELDALFASLQSAAFGGD